MKLYSVTVVRRWQIPDEGRESTLWSEPEPLPAFLINADAQGCESPREVRAVAARIVGPVGMVRETDQAMLVAAEIDVVEL